MVADTRMFSIEGADYGMQALDVITEQRKEQVGTKKDKHVLCAKKCIHTSSQEKKRNDGCIVAIN